MLGQCDEFTVTDGCFYFSPMLRLLVLERIPKKECSEARKAQTCMINV